MTTISAEIIANSVCRITDQVPPLISMQIRCPRFILAEINTHRVFSRNARSSRAVPISKMLEEIQNDPVIPLHWGRNQRGMQAETEIDAHDQSLAREEWLSAMRAAVSSASRLNALGLHKQVVNRLLEPFMHVDVLITATDWDNFFALRDHADAEPHIRILAQRMKEAIEASTPRVITHTGMTWHLPFVTESEYATHGLHICRKLSVARCARISYAPFDGNASIEREIERYEALVGSVPRHSSPAEHQAQPDFIRHDGTWEAKRLHGNLNGWRQYRRYLDLGLESHKSLI